MQTLSQALPPAEIGTAQQEIPVAQFKATSFEVSMTLEEVWILTEALTVLRHNSEQSPMFAVDMPDSRSLCEIEDLLEQFKKISN